MIHTYYFYGSPRTENSWVFEAEKILNQLYFVHTAKKAHKKDSIDFRIEYNTDSVVHRTVADIPITTYARQRNGVVIFYFDNEIGKTSCLSSLKLWSSLSGEAKDPLIDHVAHTERVNIVIGTVPGYAFESEIKELLRKDHETSLARTGRMEFPITTSMEQTMRRAMLLAIKSRYEQSRYNPQHVADASQTERDADIYGKKYLCRKMTIK